MEFTNSLYKRQVFLFSFKKKMSHSAIKKNIHRLLSEKDWKISDLEQRIGANRSVANILRGSSKNPTVELLQSIAKAFDVEVQDLLDESSSENSIITNTTLLLDTCRTVIDEINQTPLAQGLNYKKIIAIIKEVYEYSMHLDLKSIDVNFVKWTIHKYLDN